MYVNGKTLVRTRFAQDPADRLNVNNVRVAIFNYLFAKRYGGTFVLRVDDTENTNEFAVEQVFDDLKWLGLNWDDGPIFQSHRQAHYRDVATTLVRNGLAYPDDGENEFGDKIAYRGSRRNLSPNLALGLWDDTGWPLRFKIDNEDKVVLDDLVKGQTRWDVAAIHDPVIILADGSATSLFASVVDDAEMKISHVIRGEEELSDTPAQILLATALDYVPPFFAHVPCVYAPSADRKIEKRDLDEFNTEEVQTKFKAIGFSAKEILSREELNPVNVSYYQTLGYKPEALVNYLAYLGSPQLEIMPTDRLAKVFSLNQVFSGRFDPNQLLTLAGEYTKEDSLAVKVNRCVEFLNFAKVAADPVLVKRAITLCGDTIEIYSDILTHGFFFFGTPSYNQHDLAKYLPQKVRQLLYVFAIRLKHCQWDAASIENTVLDFITGRNYDFGHIAFGLSVAIMGKATGPCVFEVMELIGREKCLERIEEVLNELYLTDYD